MKLTKLSMAAIMALGFTSAAMADVDVQFGGQAVLYYQTVDTDNTNSDLFDQGNSRGNVGLQITSKADLGNDFQAGVTVNIIGTLGLENNLVSNVMQHAETGTNNDLDGFWIPEAYVAKTVGNTTLKIGRQYLNTPFAFSETWNVFKNSFEAAVLVNKDIQDTTVVLAMVNKGNQNGLGADMGNFVALNPTANAGEDGAVYALGIINNSIENLNLSLWGYELTSAATALWADASYKLNAGNFPLTIALQGASLDPDDVVGNNKTSMFGIKLGTEIEGWKACLAYNDVDDGTLSMQQVGGVKTKLFVQQILNQGAIANDAQTWQLKVVTPSFEGFKLVAQYAASEDDDVNNGIGLNDDLNELDLIVKGKVLGTNLLVAYVNQDFDTGNDQDVVRVVARYSF